MVDYVDIIMIDEAVQIIVCHALLIEMSNGKLCVNIAKFTILSVRHITSILVVTFHLRPLCSADRARMQSY